MKIEIESTVEVKREKKLKSIVHMALIPQWVVRRSNCDLCLFEFERDEPVCAIEIEDGKVMFCHNKCVEDRIK